MFLDRDGVINRAVIRAGIPCPPASLDELEILPGVPAALSALKEGGYTLVVVTNQPDVARGSTSRDLVGDIHARLKERLVLDAILTCFHDDSDDCDCRKPKPGLLLQAARDLSLDLASSFMVGDRWRDVEAGRRAGCRTFYVDRGYEQIVPACTDFRVESLSEAAGRVLALGPR
ncbi:MAG: family hydrolase [Gammaproteobacteria bacterium]|jgi:D-glycero-D-manno-heptose 1,7-bisphosphate phosphatase|nr:family hydrolase [Gammaproteobacteria bacterium]